MGYFKKISFNNFRNFTNYSINLSSSCNVILGKNGSGKTNILEGLSLFEKGRGFKKEKIINLPNFYNQNKNFNINSIFENENIDLNISVFNSENLKKIKVNESFEKDSINYFQSLFSIIYFLPEMERLFLVTPSIRRNFLDRLIYCCDKNYNSIINKYKKLISERQFLLKQNSFDDTWIKKIELNISELAYIIYNKRIVHIRNINEILNETKLNNFIYDNLILEMKDEFFEKNINHSNNIEFFVSELEKNRKIDFYAGGCSIGPHKSDFIGFNKESNFNLNQLSTGQQKTVILLIIISQCKFLIKKTKLKPIVLLDEVCSHLDGINRELLLYLIDELQLQVFMTGTEESFFSFLSTKANYCNIT